MENKINLQKDNREKTYKVKLYNEYSDNELVGVVEVKASTPEQAREFAWEQWETGMYAEEEEVM